MVNVKFVIVKTMSSFLVSDKTMDFFSGQCQGNGFLFWSVSRQWVPFLISVKEMGSYW